MQRETRQRRTIRRILEEAGHPLSPKEVLDAAQHTVKGLGIATVYRNLRTLQDDGWIAVVEVPGDSPRYEVAGKDHHHFLCRDCDKLFEVDGCPGNVRAVTPEGFELEGHDFLLYGLCRSCAA